MKLFPSILTAWLVTLPAALAAETPSTAPSVPAKAEPRPGVSQANVAEPAADETAKAEAPAAPAKTAEAAPAVPAPAPARATNAVAALSLESFQVIGDKNIFNQSRVPRVAGRPPPSTNEVKRVPKVDAIALVGTMSYERGEFAFFDSPNADYRKTLKAGDKIAGHAIRAVEPSHVTLEWEGNALDVKVGQQLRREDEGPWQVSNRTEAFASGGGGGSSGTTSSGGASSASSSSTSGSRSEALERLLEQRKQRQ